MVAQRVSTRNTAAKKGILRMACFPTAYAVG
jgi:hypothetical protein